jgi:hypothetical protein
MSGCLIAVLFCYPVFAADSCIVVSFPFRRSQCKERVREVEITWSTISGVMCGSICFCRVVKSHRSAASIGVVRHAGELKKKKEGKKRGKMFEN